TIGMDRLADGVPRHGRAPRAADENRTGGGEQQTSAWLAGLIRHRATHREVARVVADNTVPGLQERQGNVSNEFCEIEKFAQRVEQLAFDLGFLLVRSPGLQFTPKPLEGARVRPIGGAETGGTPLLS